MEIECGFQIPLHIRPLFITTNAYRYLTCLFADDIRAYWDLWLLGDAFLTDVYYEFLSIKQKAEKDKKFIPPYILDFFNVSALFSRSAATELAMARTVNSLIEAINEKDALLLKYVIVILDKDILQELNFDEVDFETNKQMIPDLVLWLVRQINTVIMHKCVDLLEKKPGAVSGVATTVIYVRMLKRIGKFHAKSKINGICALCAKFNDALNDEVAKIEHRILTISSCNTYEHFDCSGNLSMKGKLDFIWELDDLIQRFDLDRIKLLPNPKNPPKRKSDL